MLVLNKFMKLSEEARPSWPTPLIFLRPFQSTNILYPMYALTAKAMTLNGIALERIMATCAWFMFLPVETGGMGGEGGGGGGGGSGGGGGAGLGGGGLGGNGGEGGGGGGGIGGGGSGEGGGGGLTLSIAAPFPMIACRPVKPISASVDEMRLSKPPSTLPVLMESTSASENDSGAVIRTFRVTLPNGRLRRGALDE